MQLIQPLQFFDWLRMVIHPQIHFDIVIAAVPSAFLHNINSSRLFPSAVASCVLSSCDGLQHAFSQWAFRRFKCPAHFTDCFFTDQNIALTGMMLPYYMSGPVIAFMSSEGTSLSFCIDDRHLAQTSAWIVRNELVDDFFRRQAFFQQCQSLRSKSGIRPGLCGNCAY